MLVRPGPHKLKRRLRQVGGPLRRREARRAREAGRGGGGGGGGARRALAEEVGHIPPGLRTTELLTPCSNAVHLFFNGDSQ